MRGSGIWTFLMVCRSKSLSPPHGEEPRCSCPSHFCRSTKEEVCSGLVADFGCCASHFCPQGPGKILTAEGHEYEGEWYRGARHGQGKMHFSDGSWFEGEWEDDFMKSGFVVTLLLHGFHSFPFQFVCLSVCLPVFLSLSVCLDVCMCVCMCVSMLRSCEYKL